MRSSSSKNSQILQSRLREDVGKTQEDNKSEAKQLRDDGAARAISESGMIRPRHMASPRAGTPITPRNHKAEGKQEGWLRPKISASPKAEGKEDVGRTKAVPSDTDFAAKTVT